MNKNQATTTYDSPLYILVKQNGVPITILNIGLHSDESGNAWANLKHEATDSAVTVSTKDGEKLSPEGVSITPGETKEIDLSSCNKQKTLQSGGKGKTVPANISYLSPLPGEQCGIATYTNYLKNKVENHYHASIHRDIQDNVPRDALINAQIEFGVHPNPENVLPPENDARPYVATWHTVLKKPHREHLNYYHAVDKHADLHIVHTNLQKKWLTRYTHSPIHVVRHGSLVWEPTDTEEARNQLDLPTDRDIAFCFGFAADTKGFDEAIQAVDQVNKNRPADDKVLMIISAAVHPYIEEHGDEALKELREESSEQVHILGRFLDEEEINLYASACDALVFNYSTPNWIASASGALHRVLAAGKPIVGTADSRLEELQDGHHVVKHPRGDIQAFSDNLDLVLSDDEVAKSMGDNCRRLAEATSWEKTAERHMELYGDAATDDDGKLFPPEWHDEDYFDNEGKPYRDPDGEQDEWGYRDTSTVNWGGWPKVVQRLKEDFSTESLLDVGTGTGGLVHYANRAGIKKVRGTDFSQWAADNAFRTAEGKIDVADVVEGLPYRDREFQMVTALDLLEHLYRDDLPEAVQEMHRVADSYVFYNIGAAMGDTLGERMVLDKGELPPKDGLESAIAGHVTVVGERQWRIWLDEWTGDEWGFRDDVVEEFRNSVPEEVLHNWETLIAMERRGGRKNCCRY